MIDLFSGLDLPPQPRRRYTLPYCITAIACLLVGAIGASLAQAEPLFGILYCFFGLFLLCLFFAFCDPHTIKVLENGRMYLMLRSGIVNALHCKGVVEKSEAELNDMRRGKHCCLNFNDFTVHGEKSHVFVEIAVEVPRGCFHASKSFAFTPHDDSVAEVVAAWNRAQEIARVQKPKVDACSS